MTSYTPRLDQWEKYFADQANYQLGKTGKKDKSKALIKNSAILGGVSTSRSTGQLSVVTSVKGKAKVPGSRGDGIVDVNMVSSAEATADQAESELRDMVKDSDPVSARIYKETVKRAASVPDSAAAQHTAKKRKVTKVTRRKSDNKGKKDQRGGGKSSQKTYSDIFSKKR